jgi:hypothetical protein
MFEDPPMRAPTELPDQGASVKTPVFTVVPAPATTKVSPVATIALYTPEEAFGITERLLGPTVSAICTVGVAVAPSPVATESWYEGFAVPTPTFPAAFTKSAVAPVVVRKVATFPVPSCWTLKALPDAVLPNTKQLLVFRTTGTLGTP